MQGEGNDKHYNTVQVCKSYMIQFDFVGTEQHFEMELFALVVFDWYQQNNSDGFGYIL